jgi:hypothetical protein
VPPLGRSSSTCKKNIKAWARGMMKEVGAKRERACRKEITSWPPRISYLKHEGDVLHKLCTQRKCNFAKRTILHKSAFIHKWALALPNHLLSQAPKRHQPMTIRLLCFSKCLESWDHRFEAHEWQIWTMHHRWMEVEKKQHDFA